MHGTQQERIRAVINLKYSTAAKAMSIQIIRVENAKS